MVIPNREKEYNPIMPFVYPVASHSSGTNGLTTTFYSNLKLLPFFWIRIEVYSDSVSNPSIQNRIDKWDGVPC